MESEEGDNAEGDSVEEIQEGDILDVNQIRGDDDSYSGTGVVQLQVVKGKYYKQTYRSAWEQMPDFKGWLRGVQGEPTRAYCTYCQKTLHAHRLSLLKHTCTIRHQKAAQLHSCRKTVKNALSESDLSSSEDEGAKLNEKTDPAFTIAPTPKTKRPGRPSRSSTVVVKTERRKNRRRASCKYSDFEYDDNDPEYSPPSSVEFKVTRNTRTPKRPKESDFMSKNKTVSEKNMSTPKAKKGQNKNQEPSSVKDEVAEAINQLQSLSDSIQVKEDDEFDLFGKYIASQLKQLNLVKALRAKQRIYSFLSDLRLAEIHESSSGSSQAHNNVPVAYISVPSTLSGVAPTSTVTSDMPSASNTNT